MRWMMAVVAFVAIAFGLVDVQARRRKLSRRFAIKAQRLDRVVQTFEDCADVRGLDRLLILSANSAPSVCRHGFAFRAYPRLPSSRTNDPRRVPANSIRFVCLTEKP